jgi:hypothetical protein
MMAEQIRNKYNTLTPAEAKKLNRFLGNRPPARTASVLHKPRAPPIKVTNLDNTNVTPTKNNYFPANIPERPQSASKLSLSSSTYKVFESPLANFKKLFRGMHRPFSQSNNTESQDNSNKTTTRQQQCDNTSIADLSLSDSISQISLNKSQSPTVLPPPPSELKSMCYIESGVNYSNYDEFTRARNERMRGNLRRASNVGRAPSLNRPRLDSQISNIISYDNSSVQHEQQASFNKSDDSDDSSWQMTSLPVYYERNLTKVFKEKQPPCIEVVASSRQSQVKATDFERALSVVDPDEIYQTIKPPKRFDDPNNHLPVRGNDTSCDRAPSVDSFKSQTQSFATITDATLELHRRQPATPFRFSFAQPLNDTDQVSFVLVYYLSACKCDDVLFFYRLSVTKSICASLGMFTIYK